MPSIAKYEVLRLRYAWHRLELHGTKVQSAENKADRHQKGRHIRSSHQELFSPSCYSSLRCKLSDASLIRSELYMHKNLFICAHRHADQNESIHGGTGGGRGAGSGGAGGGGAVGDRDAGRAESDAC